INVQLRGKRSKTTTMEPQARYNNNRINSVQFLEKSLLLKGRKKRVSLSTIASWKMNFATRTCRWLGRLKQFGSNSTVAGVEAAQIRFHSSRCFILGLR
ncbi:hypothetical protein TNCV_2673781, partial [Trichonephila clavipes]